MPTDKPFIHFVMEQLMITRIDDFRFAHRFHSRSATIKWLLGWALDQNPDPSGPDQAS